MAKAGKGKSQGDRPDKFSGKHADCSCGESGRRHPAPKKNVLLLSCMDSRLLDDTVQFMASYNLTNRYDHIALAGAALGVNTGVSGKSSWGDVFFDHLAIAVNLLGRKISEVFILEHRNCGAYKKLPKGPGYYKESDCCREKEACDHAHQAFQLAREIDAFRQRQIADAKKAIRAEQAGRVDESESVIKSDCDYLAEPGPTGAQRMYTWDRMKVCCFLMNLDGTVEHLFEDEWTKKRCKGLNCGKKRSR